MSKLPETIRDSYVQLYLLHDKLIDFSFIDAIKDYSFSSPLKSKEVQSLFKEMKMIRDGLRISNTYTSLKTSTEKLRKLAADYNISYSTFARKRRKYMYTTALTRALAHDNDDEDYTDRYRTCCYYCKDLVTLLHLKYGKRSNARIVREINAMDNFACSECPYHPDVKEGPHKKGDFIPIPTCMRKSDILISPNHKNTVKLIVDRIPEQMDILAMEGPNSWNSRLKLSPIRIKEEVVNSIWWSDHKLLDVLVRVPKGNKGEYVLKRPWLTGIVDDASLMIVGYCLSLSPNSDTIAEAFARSACYVQGEKTVGLPKTFYIDNGKDYRANIFKGKPRGDKPLMLNKDLCESGILEWLDINVVHSLPYNARAKTIERVWEILDNEYFKGMNGYCGSNKKRPYKLRDEIRRNDIYTFENFCDIFADVILPAYHNFKVTKKETPNELYDRLPKANTLVPSWRTLAVLKSKTCTRKLRKTGISYQNNYYWHPKLSQYIEDKKKTDFTIFAFDAPFNRTISVVLGNKYICEAHVQENIHVLESEKYKVTNLIQEQRRQLRFYSEKLEQLHNIVYQTSIMKNVDKIPPVDHIRYAPAIV